MKNDLYQQVNSHTGRTLLEDAAYVVGHQTAHMLDATISVDPDAEVRRDEQGIRVAAWIWVDEDAL